MKIAAMIRNGQTTTLGGIAGVLAVMTYLQDAIPELERAVDIALPVVVGFIGLFGRDATKSSKDTGIE